MALVCELRAFVPFRKSVIAFVLKSSCFLCNGSHLSFQFQDAIGGDQNILVHGNRHARYQTELYAARFSIDATDRRTDQYLVSGLETIIAHIVLPSACF